MLFARLTFILSSINLTQCFPTLDQIFTSEINFKILKTSISVSISFFYFIEPFRPIYDRHPPTTYCIGWNHILEHK